MSVSPLVLVEMRNAPCFEELITPIEDAHSSSFSGNVFIAPRSPTMIPLSECGMENKGIPLGAFWSTRQNKDRRFTIPTIHIIGKRLLGGVGLGMSGSIATGCTVGHGLTFAPLLGVGSLVSTLFIFLGSALVGYLTRK